MAQTFSVRQIEDLCKIFEVAEVSATRRAATSRQSGVLFRPSIIASVIHRKPADTP